MQIQKRILVTGGAGFLGSHLCQALLDAGHNVTCLDNLQTGCVRNIEHLHKSDNFNFLNHDVENPLFLEVDEIYNLACPASPVHYQADPVKTIKTSFLGALNMLDLAKKTGAKILQTSTSEVYGDPQIHPQPESYLGNVNCTGIRACYDEGKRAAESLFFDYHRIYNLQVKVVRIFNTYGPKMHPEDGRVVSNFILQALTGKPITIYGTGDQTRSFCYCDDMIAGLIAVMNNTTSDFAGPVNLGNPAEFTIRELASLIIDLTGSKSELIYKPLPLDDPTQRKPDISLAEREIDFSPRVDLRLGLTKTIEYFAKFTEQISNSNCI